MITMFLSARPQFIRCPCVYIWLQIESTSWNTLGEFDIKMKKDFRLLPVFPLINHLPGFSFKKHCGLKGKQSAICSEDTMYLLPAYSVTLPLHPPTISEFPSWCIWRDRETLCLEKPHSVELTVLCLWEDNYAREDHVSSHRQTFSLSHHLIVTSLFSRIVRYLGLISETMVKSCRGIVMSLQFVCFFNSDWQNDREGKYTTRKTQVHREW